MAFLVYDGTTPIGMLPAGETPDQARAQGYTVTEVSDSDVTTGADGQVYVSVAALQQQQAFSNTMQQAGALRALEQNQINAYGQVTNRIGQAIPLVGQTQNYGLLANITAGDPRAPYLSVPAGLARLGGPSPVQPDYAQAKTYSAKDASDFVQKAAAQASGGQTSAENQQRGSKKGVTGATQAATAYGTSATGTGSTAQQRTANQSGVSTANTSNERSVGDWGPTNQQTGAKAVSAVYNGDGSLGVTFADGTRTQYDATSPVTRDYLSRPDLAARPLAYGSDPSQALSTDGGGGGGRHQGQSAWEAHRDQLLGGQRHDDFQMAHSTTEQELNDIAKIGNAADRLTAFNALKARPAWTPATSHGSDWRAAGDVSGSPYKGGVNGQRNPANTFDYNGPALQAFTPPRDRSGGGSGGNGGNNGTNTGGGQASASGGGQAAASSTAQSFGSSDTGYATHTQKQTRNQKGGKDYSAVGGTYTMAKPSKSPMFAASGGAFDPHSPQQAPNDLKQIAAILQSPPSPSPSALESAIRECWSLDPSTGQPIYTGHYLDNAAQGTQTLPNGGMDMGGDPMGSPPMLPDGGGAGVVQGAASVPPNAPPQKPSMFAGGGTGYGWPVRDDWATNPGYQVPPANASIPSPPPPAPAVSDPSVSYSGLPPTPLGAANSSVASAAAARPPARGPAPRAASGGHGGGERSPAAGPPAPDSSIMRKVTNYYLAQFGGTPEAANADLQSGSAESAAWLRSALGMAQAGQLDQYDAAPAPANTTSAETAPAQTAAPAYTPNPTGRADAMRVVQQNPTGRENATLVPNDTNGAVMGGVNGGLRLSGGRVTTAATPTPHPDQVKADIAGMSYEDALAYLDRAFGSGARSWETGLLRPAMFKRAAGGTDVAMAPDGGGNTFVARHPTMFSVGGQQFEVGEGTLHGHPGADELVTIAPSGGGMMVHVDPLQRRGTGVPPAVAAAANLAVPGSPYAPKAGPPASAVHPGRSDYADAIGPSNSRPSPWGAAWTTDPTSQGGGLVQAVPAAPLVGPQFPISYNRGTPPTAAYGPMVSRAVGGTDALMGGMDPQSMDPSGGDQGMQSADPSSLPNIIPVGNGMVLVRQQDGSYIPVSMDQLQQMVGGGSSQGRMPRHFAAGGTDPGGYANTIPTPPPYMPTIQTPGPYMVGMDPQATAAPDRPMFVPGVRLDPSQVQWVVRATPPPFVAPLPSPAPTALAAGGSVQAYGTIAPGATITRVGTVPSKTGQVTVPGGKNSGDVTVPFFKATPFPNPEYALSRDVRDMTPDELQQVGMVTQNRAGFGVNQWAALQARGNLPGQNPASIGSYRAF